MFVILLTLTCVYSALSDDRIAELINKWRPEHGTYIWEHSGRFEGDIHRSPHKNGLLNETARWPNAIVPFKIDRFSFSDEQIATIHSAIEEFHARSCLKLRPKRMGDKNFVHFVSTSSGCWSSVGMQGGEQKLNLQTPNCVRFGVVIHELLHAVGFYHQQSAANRDEYVKIHWENIEEVHKHNFEKYDETVVTDYGVGYDYKSVMHYSGLAFSKNKLATIEAVRENVTQLGQRDGFSEADLTKLERMYGEICERRNEEDDEDSKQPCFFC